MNLYDQQIEGELLTGDPGWLERVRGYPSRVPAPDQAAAALWTAAFMDCLIERRPYELIPAAILCAGCGQETGHHPGPDGEYCDECQDWLHSTVVSAGWQDPEPEDFT